MKLIVRFGTKFLRSDGEESEIIQNRKQWKGIPLNQTDIKKKKATRKRKQTSQHISGFLILMNPKTRRPNRPILIPCSIALTGLLYNC